MGSEDLFHKRRGKGSAQLQRKKPSRETAPLYIIVCEGEKTEANYFNELRNFERIISVRIEVCGECGSAPISVVESAQRMYEDAIADGVEIQGVFCVFDKDNHESFNRACAKVEHLRHNGVPIHAIYSVPCFEYWIVLHFDYFRAPYSTSSKGSVAHAVYKHLQSIMGAYNKGATGLYSKLKVMQSNAIKHAETAHEDSVNTGQPNPSTMVGNLVVELLKYSEI